MADEVADAFRSLTGTAPQGLWSAPGRVNLIGEHTDYNDGYVLPFAIDRSAVAAMRLRRDRVARVWSLDLDAQWSGDIDEVAPGTVDGWVGYAVGVAWALTRSGVAVPGFDLVVGSTVPLGAGLSSSAALEAVVATALHDLLDLDVDRTTLALACRRAENEVVGAATGAMDQMTALHAQAGHAMLLDCRSLQVEQVRFDPGSVGLAVLVVDTRVAHANAAAGYTDRRRECESAARTLGVRSLRDASLDDVEAIDDDVLRRRARHVVTENARVLDAARLLRHGDVRPIGPLLSASHASMRDDFEISCPEIETANSALRDAGALGARLTGAGFGGCVVALLPATAVERAQTDVGHAFARAHHLRPAVFEVAPSSAAARLA